MEDFSCDQLKGNFEQPTPEQKTPTLKPNGKQEKTQKKHQKKGPWKLAANQQEGKQKERYQK